MSEPTEEQHAILRAKERIRVVRAAPGSGKTWLVGEVIRDSLESWTERGGIAALSFTNVARKEIEGSSGGLPGHPHFVGTLDSFVYQFIIKPYAHLAIRGLHPRTLPDELLHAHSGSQPLKVESAFVSPHKCVFIEPAADGSPRFRAPPPGPSEITGGPAQQVLRAKRENWLRSQRISYSDAAFLGHHILTAKQARSDHIRRILAKRFPFIVVDELQDTGWYLGRIMLTLLSTEPTRGLVVGDPNQSIYEFTGAGPAIFDEVATLPGAKEYPLTRTLRCSPQVCGTAEQLAPGTLLRTSQPAGRSILYVYDQAPASIPDLLARLEAQGARLMAPRVLARANSAIETLALGEGLEEPSFKTQPLDMMLLAVLKFINHERGWLPLAEGALARSIFGAGDASDELLAAAGIPERAWRSEVAGVLLALAQPNPQWTCHDWGLRAKDLISDAALRLTGEKPPGTRLRVPDPSTKQLLLAKCLRTREAQGRARTVHQAKGETHLETILFIPPKTSAHCPSKKWWALDGKLTEEGRIAYVAATRPKSTFVLAVSRDVATRLRSKAPRLVATFEMLPQDETPHEAKGQRDLTSFF